VTDLLFKVRPYDFAVLGTAVGILAVRHRGRLDSGTASGPNRSDHRPARRIAGGTKPLAGLTLRELRSITNGLMPETRRAARISRWSE
jgi:hypothetical protein